MNPGSKIRLSSGRGLGWNALFNLSGSVSYYVAVILVTPAAIDALGEEGWGIWQLAGAAANYAILLNLGLNSAIAYEISRGVARNDLRRVGESIHTARVYLALVGLAIAIAFVAFGRPLIRPFVQEPAERIAYLALVTTGLITAVTFPSRLFTSVIAGLQRFDLLAAFRLASGAVLIVGVLGGFGIGMGLLGFAALMSFAPAVPGLLGWIVSRQLLPMECFRWGRPDLAHLRSMLAYSVSTVLYVTGTVILYQSLKFIASWKCGGPSAAGHMGLAVSVVQILAVGFVPLAAVLQPRFGDLSARGRSEELPGLLRRALGEIGLLAVPSVAFLALETPALFRAWVGSVLAPEIVDLLSQTVRAMLVGQGAYVLFLPCFYALLGIGEHRPFGIGMLCTAVAMVVVGAVAATVMPSIQILGLVFGLTLAGLVVLITLPIAARRFRLALLPLLSGSLIVPALVALPGIAASLVRPRLESPIFDLSIAVICFGVPTMFALLIGRKFISRRS